MNVNEKIMTDRPHLSKTLDSGTFRSFYYLKEELIRFCRQEGLRTAGGKPEVTERIAHYLDTGEESAVTVRRRPPVNIREVTEDSPIEENFVCSEARRAFFKEKIGERFRFSVPFLNWLRSNAGKSYKDAIQAYLSITEEKKERRTEIGKQFEYNTYIRDFFGDNKGRTLADAIKCWRYKKSIPGCNKYERTDLVVL
ncbi:MAG: SAP domain-containing protein [Methanomassiliicoccaceae archaeon]|nr:SAP domain-containing protein [Methanomassiliicoccaceae archaeon]